MKRKITTANDQQPCPKCSERRSFVAHSELIAEDCCEIWITCQCGHEVTGDRREDVLGDIGNESVGILIHDRNDALCEKEADGV